jgi:hypothetical protein
MTTFDNTSASQPHSVLRAENIWKSYDNGAIAVLKGVDFEAFGNPHDLTVPMQIHIDGNQCIVKGHFVAPYVKWGLKDPCIFILKVAKEVDIDLTLVGNLSS